MNLESIKKIQPAMRFTILIIICSIAVLVRMFSIIKYQSIIHQFDPWFNYRSTKYLVEHDFQEFWNFFDSQSWYPLGRDVGGTVYPGIMVFFCNQATSAVIYNILNFLTIPVDIRNICVMLSPIFAAFTSLAAYLLTLQLYNNHGAGFFSALFIGIIPSYMSRSTSGSYDNQGVSIFALVFTFYLFVKACNTGSMLWALFSSLGYFYMVASWGGYSFIINMIPIYVLFLIITQRFNNKIYVTYSVFYICGTLFAMQIQFVKFNAISSSEHMASHGVFFIVQAYYFFSFLKSFITQEQFKNLSRSIVFGIGITFSLSFIVLLLLGETKWSGRSMTLLDPTYAKKYIPIVASVSQHQATTWTSYFFDLHFLYLIAPAGIYFIYKKNTNSLLFLAVYLVLSVYFSGVMVRLMLVLAPAVCITAALGISYIIKKCINSFVNYYIEADKKKRRMNTILGFILISFIVSILGVYINHAIIVGAQGYSSPSIILLSKYQGQRVYIDDYREAYYWLRMNTHPSSIIMSWWDYGYQITGFSNRTTLVDNNTWNNTHIATVGLAMSSPQHQAFEVCQKLDVDYVLVIFGGASGYSGDDINKFLWMVRIGGGVYPHIKQQDYVTYGYRIDSKVTKSMKNSLIFWQQQLYYGKEKGFDNVRHTYIGFKGYKLRFFQEQREMDCENIQTQIKKSQIQYKYNKSFKTYIINDS